MFYDYLYELTVIADEHSFSKAAKKLSVSQPALGRHMDALELSLKAKLLVRSPRGIELTSDGRYLQNVALDIVSLGESIEDYFLRKQAQKSLPRTIYVGGLVRSKTCKNLFERERTTSSCHDDSFSIRYLNDEAFSSVANALDTHLVDIVIAFRSTLNAENLENNYRCEKILDTKIDAIVEKQHPLAARKSLKLGNLREFTIGHLFGNYRNATAEWSEFKRQCNEKGFFPRSANMGWEASLGWGNWSLPDCVLVFPVDLGDNDRLVAHGKVKIPIEDAVYEMFLVARKDDDAVNEFIDRVMRLASQSEC